MIELGLPKKGDDAFVVLCLGAHADDIELGCGGTLLHFAKAIPKIEFYWVVFSASGTRGQEAARAAELFTGGCEKKVILQQYRDGFLPYSGAQVKDFFEELKSQVIPDLIFTHWQGDAHQDHRLISELTWNTFRNHLILEYEIPKYDGDLGRPNLFVPITPNVYQEKADHLCEVFQSQLAKPWFDRQTFLGLMRVRGMECNSASGYAEAFHCRKSVLMAGMNE